MSKPNKFLVAWFSALVISSSTFATIKVEDKKDTSAFVEGIFLTNQQFLTQHPALVPSSLFNPKNSSGFTISSWSKKDTLYILNENKKSIISRDSIWGYYEDHKLFIQRNGYFHKVTLLGSISLFNEVYPIIIAPFTPVSTNATKEVIPGLIDMQTGKMYPVKVKHLMQLLQKDEVLLGKYKALDKKLQKKLMYSYIEKFNDRHPLFQSF